MARVLMIDDDQDMCEEMKDILESAGNQVIMSCDPAEGLRLSESANFDIVLLDLKMPGISGYEVLSRIRQRGDGVKVMVITGAPLQEIAGIASNEEDAARKRILSCADEVINKPVNIDYVIGRIRELAGG